MNIDVLNFWTGKDTRHFFQPAVCNCNNELLMVVQEFSGIGDTYGPVEYCVSKDQAKSWSQLEVIPALATTDLGGGFSEGVADARPFYHEQTDTTIIIGCTSLYGAHGNVDNGLSESIENFRTVPVYSIRDSKGNFSCRKELSHPFFEDYKDWRVAATQISILPNGELIIPVYYLSDPIKPLASVITLKARYDGSDIVVEQVSKPFHSNVGRGIMEPSVINFDGLFYLTIRAEDGSGYVTTSTDGLNWQELSAWKFDDGQKLSTSTTQQHWVELDSKLYLVYTREDESNFDVMRWRAPLFIAEVDPKNKCIIKSSEQVALPLVRKHNIAYIMGNFHVSNTSKNSCIISDAPIWLEITKGAVAQDDRITDYESYVSLALVSV